MEKFKSGFVSILGRTNVGKSSIINSLVKEKVAAIANKPQTTRTAIRAIVNRPSSQIIFIDTPGIHKPKSKLGNTMVDTAFEVISDVDIVLFVIEADSTEIGRGDRRILETIKNSGRKTILIINKCDLVNKEQLAKIIDLYKEEIRCRYRDDLFGEAPTPYNSPNPSYPSRQIKDLRGRELRIQN